MRPKHGPGEEPEAASASVLPLDEGFVGLLRTFMEEHIPFNRLVGMKVAEVRRGFAHLSIPFKEELIGDPIKRALHGGCLSALADTTGGCAVITLLEAGSRCSTIDLRVDYLSPGRLATVNAHAEVLRVGNRVGVSSIRLFHEDPAHPIAMAMGVYAVRRA